jgi:hypothetical protein
MASRRSWVRIPSAPPFEETKELTLALLPPLLFFLAFQHDLSRFARKTATVDLDHGEAIWDPLAGNGRHKSPASALV